MGSTPVGLAVNPVTNKVYVANRNSATLGIIDGDTLGTSSVSVGGGPNDVAVNPVTNKIYVANQGGGVTVIDGTNNTTTTTPAGVTPYAIALNPITRKNPRSEYWQ